MTLVQVMFSALLPLSPLVSESDGSSVSVLFQGYVPFFVSATAGTTVYGAFDPINEIADICEKYNMWLHVDVSAKRWS